MSKGPAMERQRSFIVKPTRVLLLSFTIFSYLLFFFCLFSIRLLNFTPSTTSSSQTNLQFSNGLNAVKAKAFVALTRNLSVPGIKDEILEATHFVPAADSPSEALNVSKDPSFRESAHAGSAQGAVSPGSERKDDILGDAQVRESVAEVMGSVKASKDAILNPHNVKVSPGEGDEIVGSEVSKSGDLKFGKSALMSNYSAKNIEKEGKCDVTNGKWVFDESYPLYTNNSCPFIDEGFSCETNGRLDRDYMKWRWQPHQCNIPRFNPVKMLELIKGKRLVFVGDSINRNQWESMLCLLRGAISEPSRVYEARGRRITKERGDYSFRFIDYKCSVEYYLTHFLVHESKARVGRKRVKTLRIDAVDRGSSRWKGADILVFNTAHWWSHYKTKAGLNYYQEGDLVHPHLDVSIAYQRALRTWASWVDRHINPGKTKVFFRSSAPSHFSGGEWNAGGHCGESTQPLNDTRVRNVPAMNLIVDDVVKQMRTPVTILNITTLSGFRMDGHPSVYGRRPANGMPSTVQDCSHWCLPGVPDTWNELLYYYLQSGQKSVSTN